ncbi:MAG: 3-keto-5-aminohexanoate cleavage protein [Lentisphaeria bacterium]|nr:3-keto-5-aminohexanoate cleavage protein [Lentisphaeria bacterium]
MRHDLIINFTPTGMIPTREMTPHVPLSAAEIVDDVLAAREIGITLVHLHARDAETERPTQSAAVYAAIIEGIRRQAPELVLGVSLSGRHFTEFERRAEPLSLDGSLKPDMASLTLSSLNFNHQASINAPDMVQRLAAAMAARGIKPELEAFDAGMINYAKYLIRKGMLTPPHYMNLLFGNIACAQADLLHAGVMLRDLPEDCLWAFAGVGDAQVVMNSIAIACGGGVRVGLEDNIWYDSARTRLATNADLLRRIHTLAEANGRAVMPSREFRRLLRLRDGDGYGCR